MTFDCNVEQCPIEASIGSGGSTNVIGGSNTGSGGSNTGIGVSNTGNGGSKTGDVGSNNEMEGNTNPEKKDIDSNITTVYVFTASLAF